MLGEGNGTPLQYSAWKIPWTEEPGRLQSMWSLRVGHDWETSLSLSCIRERNGNPLQCSCLENPRDGGAWWAAIYGSYRVGHDWSDLAAAAATVMLPGGSDSKESTCSAGDPGSVPGSGRSPGEGHGNALQRSCLENSMDRRDWWDPVHGVAESDTTERCWLMLSYLKV